MTHQKFPFITFEGGEGSGKTTQTRLLYQELLKLGVDVVLYREPGGTKGSEEIRHLILKGDGDRWSPRAEALLMSASRAELVHKHLRPQLEKGWVICDRFADSTTAYQGFGHRLGYELIEELNHFTIGDLTPDLTFIFQLNAELGLERTRRREGSEDRYENFDLSFHHRVEEGYKEILKRNPERCVPINALLDIDTLSHRILKEVTQRFGL